MKAVCALGILRPAAAAAALPPPAAALLLVTLEPLGAAAGLAALGLAAVGLGASAALSLDAAEGAVLAAGDTH